MASKLERLADKVQLVTFALTQVENRTLPCIFNAEAQNDEAFVAWGKDLRVKLEEIERELRTPGVKD